MVSFRYLIVSTVASFLFLATGIVIGTTTLNGPITQDLRNQVEQLKDDNRQQAETNKSLSNQIDSSDEFVASYAGRIVSGMLTGQSLIIIRLPGSSSEIEDGVLTQLQAAGAKITGRLELTPDFISQSRATELFQFANGDVRPAGLQLTPVSDGRQLCSELLADVVVGKATPDETIQVLAGFAALHALNLSGSFQSSSTVIVIGSGSVKKGDTDRSGTLFEIVNALQTAGAKTLVVGDLTAAYEGGVIAQIRTRLKSSVATVDNANSALGQVAVALATAKLVKGGVGHYGVGPGATAVHP